MLEPSNPQSGIWLMDSIGPSMIFVFDLNFWVGKWPSIQMYSIFILLMGHIPWFGLGFFVWDWNDHSRFVG